MPSVVKPGEGPVRELAPLPMTPTPNANLLPAMPAELAPPSASHTLGCSTCGDVNPTCADPGCAGGMPLGPKEPVWMSYSALLLWFQPQRFTFPLAVGGAPGQPTRTLLDGRDELGQFLGMKIDSGLWLNKDHTIGAGIDGFITEHRSSFQTITGGPGSITIQRPFFDVVNGAQATLTAANADPANGLPAFAGSMATATTARLASLGGSLHRNVAYSDVWQVDLMYGFRYYDLDESLSVYQRSVLPTDITRGGVTVFPAGSAALLRDRVYTRNQFYGGEIGTRIEWKHRLGFIAFTPKLAFGSMHQVTQIDGDTKGEGMNAQTFQGGLLAAGTNGDGNLGRYQRNRFTVATDIGSQVGVNITKNTQLVLGYQFYYLANVARPIQQLDSAINTRVVPISPSFGALTGIRSPNVTFDREGFYAHGVSVAWRAIY
ncbi:BBP7 family outer membrane beta-barrel protein [Limnoglobus roseus]|nr:BBP7 family outer membrane beta-barrel protein [Limnoglobus roseus]